ncbi:EF-hand domain-containing protein 1 [Rhizophlyctis rosea]|uniref:EF-hand domain-containing protein 1 n=1 Tax=Rhizophlyctis rosea TaxID=64517 RepID=A0AAD5S6D9_9FUNG|nr:EF-hand domain-containing protein 1 [Rhizophlyctis rosea]
MGRGGEQIYDAVPFLPGNTFRDTTKTNFHVTHTLDYKNGYPIKHIHLPKDGEGKSLDSLLQSVGSDPWITYGEGNVYGDEEQGVQKKGKTDTFIPAHVAFDKVVLRFDAYFKQTVHESTEQYHLRRVRILYYVEDDSIAVVEPPVENSGIPQGVLIKRQKMPKSSTEWYDVRDFNLGVNVTFYGKTFRIVGCDKFTERYMRETEHIALNAPEAMPQDPYQTHRSRPTRRHGSSIDRSNDKLKRFLENDRKVLRFFCVWDDRDSMFGELREFVLHYFLVDDSVEVREVHKPNDGRDPFPILLRRQKLPKAFNDLVDVHDTAKYTWRDFRIGSIINVLGRRFLIRDCDDYTRRFYRDNIGIPPSESKPLQYPPPPLETKEVTDELPPYNGFGSVEDSLGSCKYLVLKPPKKDFIKMLENEHKVLRFVAKLESKHKEDKDRRFVISYRLADDMMTIYEPPQRNAGVLGGKFMERTRVLLPTSSLTDPTGPKYYTVRDLSVGSTLTINAHTFILLDADEYVFNYMESQPNLFPHSDPAIVAKKIDQLVARTPGAKQAIADVVTKCDPNGRGWCERKKLVEEGRKVWGQVVTDHEVITLARQFEDNGPRKVNYQRIIENL